jgi:2-succinyl-5-enolpyruvyl-6-hydroxy-3-cyclohexene-1-carboxylate synthase
VNPGAAVEAAAALLSGLIGAGLRDVVLCPGSRSAPLAYAAQAAERDGLIRLHVRHDERTAGFVALGLGRVGGVPAAVVTTSGTAVANLVPAALEAHHAGIGLLLLTADRPIRLRGTWANQTSDLQHALFGGIPVLSVDIEASSDGETPCLGADFERRLGDDLVPRAIAAATGERPGPVHLNLCFDEPLQPAPDQQITLDVAPKAAGDPARSGVDDECHTLPPGLRTVVVAADGTPGDAATSIAQQAGWPLLAEPTSGARSGPCVVGGYRLLLDSSLGHRVERVVVFGRPTLSRPVTRLIDRADEVVLVGPPGPGPGRRVRRASAVRVAEPDDPRWLGEWLAAGQVASSAVRTVLDEWPRPTGPAVAAVLAAVTTSADALVVGASNPIRDLDLAADTLPESALVVANRGLAGIDGTISTALGVAVASARPTRALVGDLTFLHDLAGLAVPIAERDRLRLTVVVLNDDGGGIFSMLEHAEQPGPFERVFATPVGADLGRLCAGYRVPHRMVTSITELAHALADVPYGIDVVEVPAHRTDLRPLHAAIRARLQAEWGPSRLPSG